MASRKRKLVGESSSDEDTSQKPTVSNPESSSSSSSSEEDEKDEKEEKTKLTLASDGDDDNNVVSEEEEEEAEESDDDNVSEGSSSSESDEPPKKKSKKKAKKPKKKKEKKTSSSKPSLKLGYINGKRKYNEELLKPEKTVIILKYLWKMMHEVWKCSSDRTETTILELADEDKLLPLSFMGETDNTTSTAIDVRGMLDWKIIDPVDQYEIRVFFIHSLGTPILKHIKMGPKQRAVIIIDNRPSSEKETPLKDVLILRAKYFMYDFREQYYNKLSNTLAVSNEEVITVLKDIEKDITRYPLIFKNDIRIIYYFGFNPPSMINTPQVSISCGIANYWRAVINERS